MVELDLLDKAIPESAIAFPFFRPLDSRWTGIAVACLARRTNDGGVIDMQRTMQVDLVHMQRKADNVEYRVTVLETAMASQQAQQQRISTHAPREGDMSLNCWT